MHSLAMANYYTSLIQQVLDESPHKKRAAEQTRPPTVLSVLSKNETSGTGAAVVVIAVTGQVGRQATSRFAGIITPGQ